ncbi:MAG: ABC transporter ATP-binding protein/permease [Proteobacteria bacterium]|nr:ABC transporter ATP-binding protein/permease [Pseudomonadota bacterium]MBU1738768.1 ABC transporter ATP-binding protein/permease [Pseudomonadota bacterium]
MFAAAISEMISLSAVFPFLSVLTSPDRVLKYPVAKDFALRFGIVTPEQLVLVFTVIFATAAFLAGSVRLLQLWVNTRFAFAVGHDLSAEVYRRTLYQPYHVHLARNSSEVISGVDKVTTATEILFQMLSMFSSLFVASCLVFTMEIVDPFGATLAFLGFGSIYGLITWLIRGRLLHNSKRVAREQVMRLKAMQEGLGGIRDILLGGHQSKYCKLYGRADLPMRTAQGNNRFFSMSPRYAIEALGMVLIAFLAYGLARKTNEMHTILPTLGGLVFGAQRLLPALQQIYGGWANITGNKASLIDVLMLLDQPFPEELLLSHPLPLNFRREIRFESVDFHYRHDGPWVLKDLDLVIPYGARVGFVGGTGSGKSTTLDLLMGLLQPTTGNILVDGTPLTTSTHRSWQRIISHVPQSIYLADTTLAENIAFGENPENIDMDRVKLAARHAQIKDFIENTPDGYETMVGERGVRLSGGQRQRIGIARALYGQAKILVFDEATSALDNMTERMVMDAIKDLDSDLTILIVAHRLSTVCRCQIIFEMDKGRVVSQGTYEQLLKSSASFKEMAEIGNNN